MSSQIHRKLSNDDYMRARWCADNNYTIREIAATFGISTKFVNKLLAAEVVFDQSGGTTFILNNDLKDAKRETMAIGSSYTCSCCDRYFSSSGDLSWHHSFYSSGGCLTVMAGFVQR